MCLAGKAVRNTSAWQVKSPAKLFFRLIKAFSFFCNNLIFFTKKMKNKTKTQKRYFSTNKFMVEISWHLKKINQIKSTMFFVRLWGSKLSGLRQNLQECIFVLFSLA